MVQIFSIKPMLLTKQTKKIIKLLEKICQLFFIFYIHILGPISKIREVREGEKDYSKRLDPYDVRRKAYFT